MATKKAGKKAPSKKKTPAKARGGAALKLASVAPSLTVNDLGKSLPWYRDVLGFRVTERWERNGVLQGAELGAGDMRFMIGQDDWKKGRNRKKGAGFRLYCETTQNIDTLAAELRPRGGHRHD